MKTDFVTNPISPSAYRRLKPILRTQRHRENRYHRRRIREYLHRLEDLADFDPSYGEERHRSH